MILANKQQPFVEMDTCSSVNITVKEKKNILQLTQAEASFQNMYKKNSCVHSSPYTYIYAHIYKLFICDYSVPQQLVIYLMLI